RATSRIEALQKAWAIYFEKRKTVRISLGEFDSDTIQERKKFRAIIKNLPKDALESSMLRQFKNINVKMVFIPENNNIRSRGGQVENKQSFPKSVQKEKCQISGNAKQLEISLQAKERNKGDLVQGVDKRILKGPNFARLHGSSTEEPIQVLNSILEDAKKKEKEFTGITEHYTKLQLQIGIYNARIVNDSWSLVELPKLTPEIKIRSEEKTRGKKPKWFSLLKEKIIENAEERTIKPKWISGQANQFGSSVLLLEISNNKRKKEWSKEARETYNKDPPENEQEFKNLCSLESPKKELILQAELNEKLKEEILAILTRNLNCQKRKYCYYTDGSLQKDNKDKGNTAIMGLAIVQVDEKEE
ncbi:10810_t:CDS:2, partial [Gigaspora margarita]